MKRGLFFIGLLLFFLSALAQDPQYNSVNQSLVSLNSSYAGSEKCLRNQTNYRNQWPNLSGTNLTYQTCFDGYIKPLKAGIALTISSDDEGRGTLRRTGISLSYAQYIKMRDDITIVPSVRGSYDQSILDKGRLNFNDVIDARYGIIWNTSEIPRSSVKYSDLAAGLMVKYDHNFEIGVSLSNLMEPNISHLGTYHLPLRTTIHGLNRFIVNRASYADFSFIATYQNSYYNVRGNIIFKGERGLTYGFGYGESNSFYVLPGASIKFQKNLRGFLGYTTPRVRILYSYDQNVNKSSGNMASSHEISMEIKFKKKKPTRVY